MKTTRAALLAVMLALPGSALAENNPEAVAALRAIAADPSTPVPAVLSQIDFHSATYLLDDLTPGERRRLGEYVRRNEIHLPSIIESAVRMRTERPLGRGGGR